MVITLFWSRFRDDLDEAARAAYQADAARMQALVEQAPGFVAVKSYRSEDGERLTISVFETEEQQAAWRQEPEHVAAQERGRERYYKEYRVQVCTPAREHVWSLGNAP